MRYYADHPDMKKEQEFYSIGGVAIPIIDDKDQDRAGTTQPILFPWPSSRLSGNNRMDLRSLTADRRQAREVGYWLIKDAGLKLKSVPLELHLVLMPPDRRRRDDDNVFAAFKSYRDGMFRALELDDRLIRRTVIEWGDVMKGGGIYVRLTEMEKP